MRFRFLSEAGLLDLPDLDALAPSLHKLWLSQNALRTLPASLGTLQQLQVLIASGNIFKDLPPVRLCRRGCHDGVMQRTICLPLQATTSRRCSCSRRLRYERAAMLQYVRRAPRTVAVPCEHPH